MLCPMRSEMSGVGVLIPEFAKQFRYPLKE
jgi:hypothetical protein